MAYFSKQSQIRAVFENQQVTLKLLRTSRTRMQNYYQVFKLKGECIKNMVFQMSENLEKSINSVLNDYTIL